MFGDGGRELWEWLRVYIVGDTNRQAGPWLAEVKVLPRPAGCDGW
jgi:hypothetical protein